MTYFFYKASYYIFELDLKNLKMDWKNPHIIFDVYSNQDYSLLDNTLRSIEKKLRPFKMDDVEKRLNTGHMLFIAKQNGKIIGFFWVATRCVKVPDFHAIINLNEQEAYDYNNYIVEEFRGKNINMNLKKYAFDILKQQGYNKIFNYIHTLNKSSLRANEKIGYRTIGKTTLIRIMTLEHRYHNFSTKKIIFQGGVLRLWKTLFSKSKDRDLIDNSEYAKTNVRKAMK